MIRLLIFLTALFVVEPALGTDLNPTPPISHGAYYGGVLGPGFEITFDGSGSHDTDIDDLGQTPKWRWDFDYNGSFSANKTTTSALTTWEYSQPGAYTVAVQYVDNDNQTGQTYTFQINVTNPRHYYYIKDHLGSIRTTVDEDGNVSGYDDYYPFGLAMHDRSVNTGNPNDDVKFTGYEKDDEANLTLYHANARMYDPVIGRFMQVDPILNEKSTSDLFELHNGRLFSKSPYTYAFNSPLSYIDPDGKVPFLIPAIPFAIKGAVSAYAIVKATVITATVAAGAYTVHNVSQNVEFDNLVETIPDPTGAHQQDLSNPRDHRGGNYDGGGSGYGGGNGLKWIFRITAGALFGDRALEHYPNKVGENNSDQTISDQSMNTKSPLLQQTQEFLDKLHSQ